MGAEISVAGGGGPPPESRRKTVSYLLHFVFGCGIDKTWVVRVRFSSSIIHTNITAVKLERYKISPSSTHLQWTIPQLTKILNSTSLDKYFITAWKSITKLVIFQSFVAKCCKMRII
jgi:hypothetical protein